MDASSFGMTKMKPYYQEGKPGKELIIYHGDFRTVLPELGIFDLVLTDPPYGVGLEYNGYHDTEYNLINTIIAYLPLILRSGVVTLLTPGTKNMKLYPSPDWIISWHYGMSFKIGAWGNCSWQPVFCYGRDPYLRELKGPRADAIIDQDTSTRADHPCPKPIRFWKWLLKRGASRENDKICDPFLGSGTTLLCAKELGHMAVGIEQSERYCEVSANRLRQGTLY